MTWMLPRRARPCQPGNPTNGCTPASCTVGADEVPTSASTSVGEAGRQAYGARTASDPIASEALSVGQPAGDALKSDGTASAAQRTMAWGFPVLSRRSSRRALLVAAVGLGTASGGVGFLVWRNSSGRPAVPDHSLTQLAHVGAIRIGVDPSYPPFEGVSPTGVIEGFDIDLARALAQALKVTPRLVPLGLDGFYDALRAEKIDAAISSIVPSPRAGRDIAFSIPYFNAGLVLCLPPDATATSLPQLRGRLIGVELGSEADDYVRGRIGKRFAVRVAEYDDIRNALAALAAGRLAGVLTDAPTAALLHRRIPGYVIASRPVTTMPYAVAFRAADRAVIATVDYWITQFQTDGFLKRLAARWL